MKKILIFGASGLLGNAAYKYLSSKKLFDVYGTISNDTPHFSNKFFFHLDVLNYYDIHKIMKKIQPDWVINCIADIRTNPDDPVKYFFINSTFPQLINYYGLCFNCQFVNFSSNGVFSGDKGAPYSNCDIPDAKDIYGVSKILSENVRSVVIRTSLIGHSLDGKTGLLDWFLNTAEKEVSGYAGAYWNGVTTLTLAKIVERIILKNIVLKNIVMQIASEKKSKYELLKLFKDIYQKDVIVNRDEGCIEDRTLKPSLQQKKHFNDLIIPLADQIRELKCFYKK